jgi:hypothetical protein
VGLDWLPGNRPRAGYESEFEAMFPRLMSGASQADRDRFKEITETAFDTLGAPTVGVDPAADDWARRVRLELEDEPEEEPESEAEFLRRLAGFRVLDLVPECDGLPRYTNGSPGAYVEAYSFRGKFLHDCADELGEDLLERAYTSMIAADLLVYGRELLAIAADLADRHGLDPDHLTVPEFADAEMHTGPLTSPEFKVDVLTAAGRWCVFWAERGHFLDVYA